MSIDWLGDFLGGPEPKDISDLESRVKELESVISLILNECGENFNNSPTLSTLELAKKIVAKK